MTRHRISALAGLVLLAAPRFASAAVVAPTATLTVDGTAYTIPVSKDSDGIYEVGGGSGWQMTTSGFYAQLSGAIDPDPAIDYGFSVTDFGTPSNFSFNFSDPIAFPAGPSVVFSSISGGLNDVTGNGASVTPTTSTKVQESSVGNGGPLTNMGVDVGNTMVVPATGSANTQTYGPFNSGPIGGPAGPWNTLEATAAFSLSGGGDIFSATGHAEIVVPEPASLGLLAAAIPMLRRRRAK
jgi:hypothetical protein